MSRSIPRQRRRAIPLAAGICLLAMTALGPAAMATLPAAAPTPLPAQAVPGSSTPAAPAAATAPENPAAAANALGLIRVGYEGWRVFRGPYRDTVTDRAFFVAVGRADLAAQDDHRRATLAALYYGGLGTSVAGAVLLIGPALKALPRVPVVLSLGLIVGGLVAAYTGERVYDHPTISQDEADDLVHAYNQRLFSQSLFSRPGGPSSSNAALPSLALQFGGAF